MNQGLLSVEEALERLLAGARAVSGTETVPTLGATGRVLAQSQTSSLNVPPLDNTSMDGYAVRAADCASGAARLRVAQRIAAGAIGKPPLHPDDPHIVAIATDRPFASPLPQFGLNDHDAIADFVLAHHGFKRTMLA